MEPDKISGSVLTMDENVKISVIVPIYNRKEYLHECVASILSQTLDGIEIILVDDGSGQEVRNMLDELSELHDSIGLVHKEHEGAWAARNHGIKIAKGKYVCFLDSDDYYANEKSLEILYTEAENHVAKICGGNIVDVYEDGRKECRGEVFRSAGLYQSSLRPQMYGHTRYLYNREFIKKNNLRYRPLKRFEDPPFVLEAFLKAETYHAVDEVVYCCRQYKRDRLYSHDVICDIARGILMCCQIAKEYQNKRIFELEIENALNSIYEQCCYHYMKKDKTLHGILNNIQEIQMDMTGKRLKIMNEGEIKKWIEPCLETWSKVSQYDAIIIYGAGDVGKALVMSGIINAKKIIGFAVTERGREENVLELPVRELKDYGGQSDAYFMIAVSEEKRKDMEETLEKIGYKNYGFMDGRGVRLASYLKKQKIEPFV